MIDFIVIKEESLTSRKIEYLSGHLCVYEREIYIYIHIYKPQIATCMLLYSHALLLKINKKCINDKEGTI
jgi:hypothetical protein